MHGRIDLKGIGFEYTSDISKLGVKKKQIILFMFGCRRGDIGIHGETLIQRQYNVGVFAILIVNGCALLIKMDAAMV